MTALDPTPAALDRAIGEDSALLAEIDAVKARFRDAVAELCAGAVRLGVPRAAAESDTASAEDILADLFFLLEEELRDRIERDESTLERMGW